MSICTAFKRTIAPVVFFSMISIVSGGAIAQDPQRTTATYDDWLVQCRLMTKAQLGQTAPAKEKDKKKAKKAKAGGDKRICEMVQTFTFRRTGQQLAKLAIGQLPGEKTVKAVVQTPLAVYLPAGIVFKLDGEKDQKGQFIRCTKTVCLAQLDFDDKTIELLRTAKTATLTFTNTARRPISLRVSLKGFVSAYKATIEQRAG